jgi:hypothetical protein
LTFTFVRKLISRFSKIGIFFGSRPVPTLDVRLKHYPQGAGYFPFLFGTSAPSAPDCHDTPPTLVGGDTLQGLVAEGGLPSEKL